jgi:hypothetical protein
MKPTSSSEPQFTIHDAPPQPIKDGDDMDQLMHEVGKELKKDDQRPPKHHLFSRKKPADKHKPVPAQPAAHPAAAGHPPQPTAKPQPNTHSTPIAKQPKSPTPVLVITVTIIVTGILIAAAIAASK